MKKRLINARSILVALVAVLIFGSCSKQADVPGVSNEEALSLKQIDSIAASYGYKRNDSAVVENVKSISPAAFISKMKARAKTSARVDGAATLTSGFEIEETTYVDNLNYDYFAENGLYTRHFNFLNFKNSAYPSLYTFTVMSDGFSCTLLGTSFEYVGLSNDAPEVTWTYAQTGGYAMGTPRQCDVFVHGICNEYIQLAGHNYNKIYRVEFQCNSMDFMFNVYSAKVKLIQVG